MIAAQPSTPDDKRVNSVREHDRERSKHVSNRSLRFLAFACLFLLSSCHPATKGDRVVRYGEGAENFNDAVSAANGLLASSQYSAAMEKLSAAISMAEEDASLASSLHDLTEKQSRLSRLARFVECFEYGQELNFLARDSEAMSVLLESLDAVGVWESDQWWDNLPSDDLTPLQLDTLQWDVYRALLTLDGLLVRRMGAALGGMSDSGMAITLSMVRRYVMTDAGVNESKAAIEVGRRIEAFRPSQATRWYTATSNFRLRQGQRVKASDLGPPENAADGYSLSILCLIAFIDPTFTTWFSGYGSLIADGDTPPPSNLEALLQTIQSATKEAPSHYWTHLAQGHAHYWMGEADRISGNQHTAIDKFEAAREAFTRCIDLRPDAPFAYCDRSTVERREATVLRRLSNASLAELEEANQLMQKSLHDAKMGVSLAPESDWVHWHEGLTLAETGNDIAAVERFLMAAQSGMDFGSTGDSLLAKVIDLRGRTEAIEYAERKAGTVEDPTLYLSLLSVLHFSRGDLESSRRYAMDTLHRRPSDATANTVIGWDKLRSGDMNDAKAAFEIAMADTPSNTWTMLGLARFESETGNLEEALRLNDEVLRSSKSQRQQVAACFAIAKVYWRQSDPARALDSICQARKLDPACDLNVVVREAVTDYRAAHAKMKIAAKHDRDQIQAHTDAMKHLLIELSNFPIASPKRILDSIPTVSPQNQPLAPE